MAFQYQNAWYAIKRKLLEDRKEFVEQLVNDQEEMKTARLRGRISMLDEIIERYPRELSETESDDE